MRKNNLLLCICTILALLVAIPDSAMAGGGFKIEAAKWEKAKKRLTVKGKGRKGKKVTLSYAANGEEIGSKRIGKKGWKFQQYKMEPVPCNILVEQSDGKSSVKRVEEAPSDCDEGIVGNEGKGDGDGQITNGDYTILAANDLGMHCADQDYRIFSILPPYNVLNAQVIEKGQKPRILSADDGIKVTYTSIESNAQDPNGANLPPIATDSITATSQNTPGISKSNFWDPSDSNPGANGFATYESLYPTGVLGAFPFLADLGLPAPDLAQLYFGADRTPDTGDEPGALAAHQAAMPGITAPYTANVPQQFGGYIKDLPFFVGLPDIGYIVKNFKRFTAEGIPILPVDDQGRENPYPLMRVEARNSSTDRVLAQVDVVLPVASEADCQQCHASQAVCDLTTQYTLVCDDIANTKPGVAFIDIDPQTEQLTESVPGDTVEQQVLNVAKINILRLHDSKHATNPGDTKLDDRRNIVCASCHYSPALDLAHLGPNDDNGKEQTQHISMSRAMHASHGNLNKQPQFDQLFPDMPPPGQRTAGLQEEILQDACYNCHPGKRTKCLRGAMGGGGIVCQDCHGQMAQVGDDFSDGSGSGQNKRVPWASEPKCQSCHMGDVLQVADLYSSGMLNDASVNVSDSRGNSDGLRLNMTYKLSDHSSNGGPDNLSLLNFSDSRFASNKPLFRLSGGDDGSGKGHGGLFCEGCHGSTHAIWPNANALANDNKAAQQLQGHTGTIIECNTCHAGDLGMTLKGPHGMHPVGDTKFAQEHEDFAKKNANACRACHGLDGEGSVLSRTATPRLLQAKEDHITVSFPKGTPVGCGDCHENKLRNP